ncbi:MAG: hypothetical protein GEU73_10935 [Chloroflexi bacterium]|nr:hypothetical protein [Chloroflexota bacterium]
MGRKAIPQGEPWPHVRQICRVERRRLVVQGGQVRKREVEVSYAITSALPERADATQLLTGSQRESSSWGGHTATAS